MANRWSHCGCNLGEARGGDDDAARDLGPSTSGEDLASFCPPLLRREDVFDAIAE